MGFIEVLILSCSLAVDATTVSITNGLVYKNYSKKKMIFTSLLFGLFQGIMPLVGYYLMSLTSLNSNVDSVVKSMDHWIALALLCYLGGKMVFDGIKEVRKKESSSAEENDENNDDLTIGGMLLQSVATSIDALAVGISLYASLGVENYQQMTIWGIVPVIVVVTFILSLIGGLFGKKIGSIFNKVAPFIGGIVLIVIGFSILLEHTIL